jgi:hypothetical protein
MWDGVVCVPRSLEAAISNLEQTDRETLIQRLPAAIIADFGDIYQYFHVFQELSAEKKLHLARRFGWTLKGLTDWNPELDRHGFRIEATLASVAAWNIEGDFWEVVHSQLQGAHFTINAFEDVLRSRVPQAQVSAETPLWEQEHLQALQEAERQRDWASLGERTKAFHQLPCADLGAQQATLALSRLDWPRLVRLADRGESWLQCHFLMAHLSLADALRLATASRNGYARFTALERVTYREVRDLLAPEEAALRNLLIVLAKDVADWSNWLLMCNRYPVRYPHIQVALGKALARSEPSSLQAYVNSISLGTSDRDIRENVTRCLSTFRTKAQSVSRLALWRAAFERWNTWNFAIEKETMLSSICRSALDFGVMGWLVEGAHNLPLNDLEQFARDELCELDMEWHASISSAVSSFYRIMSRYQVLAHAERCLKEDVAWLPGPSFYLPSAASDAYLRRRYDWHD